MKAAAAIAPPMALSEAAYAARCEARALLFISGQLSLHDAVDELQAYAEQSGLIDRLGQDEVQRIMAIAFAAVDLPPEPAVSAEPIEAPTPAPPTRGSCRTAASTIMAFRYVMSLNDLKRLKAWLADHPADAPALFKLSRASDALGRTNRNGKARLSRVGHWRCKRQMPAERRCASAHRDCGRRRQPADRRRARPGAPAHGHLELDFAPRHGATFPWRPCGGWRRTGSRGGRHDPFGDGGGGRTTVALQLAVAVERDLGDWLGTTCEAAAGDLFSGEEPEDGNAPAPWPGRTKARLEPPTSRTCISTFADPAACLLGISRRKRPDGADPLFEALRAAALDIRPALIVVDSIAAAFGGNQNDRVHARTFVGMFRQLAREAGCAVCCWTIRACPASPAAPAGRQHRLAERHQARLISRPSPTARAASTGS